MVSDYSDCIGCGACSIECPVNCISIIRQAGQYIPIVDESKCIKCQKCERVCIALHVENLEFQPSQRAFYGFARQDRERRASSSGGIFYSIAKEFIKKGGLVAGAAFDENFVVRHRVVSSVAELDAVRGSKYVESDMSSVFTEIKKNLDVGNKILFSGVPCQVGAIKTFLGKNYDNLYTCEVFCHGAPRSGIFEAYKSAIVRKSGRIQGFNFRSKYYGWSIPAYEIKTDRKNIINKHKDNIYHLMFGYHVSLRDSCYNCHFRRHERVADLSLGDFWGIEQYYPSVQTSDGISAVIVNTENGQKLIDDAEVFLEPCSMEEIYHKNKWMITNFDRPKEQIEFISDYKTLNSTNFIRKYEIKFKVINRIKRIVRRVIG